jgi:hypothetical protein
LSYALLLVVVGLPLGMRRWAAQPQGERRPMCTDRKTWMNRGYMLAVTLEIEEATIGGPAG